MANGLRATCWSRIRKFNHLTEYVTIGRGNFNETEAKKLFKKLVTPIRMAKDSTPSSSLSDLSVEESDIDKIISGIDRNVIDEDDVEELEA